MKIRKTLSSFVLCSLLLGTTSPTAVLATTVSEESSTQSATEASTTTRVDETRSTELDTTSPSTTQEEVPTTLSPESTSTEETKSVEGNPAKQYAEIEEEIIPRVIPESGYSNHVTREDVVAWARGRVGKYSLYSNSQFYNGQCVALIRLLAIEKFPAWVHRGNAVDYISKVPLPSGWQRIKRTAGFVPQPGDILLYDGTAHNPWGHIGIVIEATKNGMLSVEQNVNEPNGAGGPAKYIRRSNIDIWGVIRPAYAASRKAIRNNSSASPSVYRLYNPAIKRHLYTQNNNEADVLQTRGWDFEGETFRTAKSGTPVYRLYNPILKEHLYTTNKKENDILATRGWNAEGIAWYSSGKKPIYRLYHPGLNIHLYTADKNEVNVLVTRGWNNENVSFYAN